MPANRISKLRQMAGMLQVDLASKFRVSERTVDRWERGQVQIPDTTKLRLADYFAVSVTFLMGWDDDENGNGTGKKEQAAA